MKTNLQTGPSFNGNFIYKTVKEVAQNGEVKYFDFNDKIKIPQCLDAFFSGGIYSFSRGVNKAVEIFETNKDVNVAQVENIISYASGRRVLLHHESYTPHSFNAGLESPRGIVVSPEYSPNSVLLKKAAITTIDPKQYDTHVFYEA